MSIPVSGVPRMPEETPEADLEELSRVAGLFKLPQLQTICLNLQNEEEFLNPSIGTFLNDETGATMKTMFFNQPEYSDVVFSVQGRLVSYSVSEALLLLLLLLLLIIIIIIMEI